MGCSITCYAVWEKIASHALLLSHGQISLPQSFLTQWASYWLTQLKILNTLPTRLGNGASCLHTHKNVFTRYNTVTGFVTVRLLQLCKSQEYMNAVMTKVVCAWVYMFVHSVCLVYACKLQYYEYSKSYTCLFVCVWHSLISYRFICIPFRAHDNSQKCQWESLVARQIVNT